jgi:uncharacterized protein YggE
MRKLGAIVGAVTCALALSACGETVTIGDGGVAQGITVQASGVSDVVPDAVRISLSVSVLADTSEAALAEAANVASVVREVLVDQKIDEADVATQTLSVSPEYSYTEAEGQKIVGYRASQVFDVLVREADTAGVLIDQLVSRGGKNLSINSTNPVLLDATAGAVLAREDAVKKARAKAEAYAELLDVELGEIVYLTEVAAPTNVVVGMKSDAVAESAPPVIDLGTQQVTITIEVRWKLR